MTIRNSILQKSPFSELVCEKFLEASSSNEALGYALEGVLRSIPSMGGVDGFNSLYIIDETATTLKIIGLTYVLPNSVLPLEASFSIENGNIVYRVLLGSDDGKWGDLTDSKRWNAVYLYATEGDGPRWNWRSPIEGHYAN